VKLSSRARVALLCLFAFLIAPCASRAQAPVTTWHIPMQQRNGVAASIPSLLNGQLYIATDTNELWFGNASSNTLLAFPVTLQGGGSAVAREHVINFTGSGVTVSDDPTNHRTNVSITSSGTSPGGLNLDLQFNNAGAFGGNGQAMFDPSTGYTAFRKPTAGSVGGTPGHGLEVITGSDPAIFAEGNNNASIQVSNGSSAISMFTCVAGGYFSGTSFFDSGLVASNGNTMWFGGSDGARLKLLNGGQIQPTSGYTAPSGSAGITHTVPLAPLTSGGTAGSLTFEKGILIAATDPT